MTKPVRNQDLLRKVASGFDRKPQKWEQGTWITLPEINYDIPESQIIRQFDVCSTSQCIAGATLLADQPDKYLEQAMLTLKTDILGMDLDEEEYDEYWGYHHWHDYGATALGLTEQEASFLFQPSSGPVDGLTVSDALRAIADGADVDSVWQGEFAFGTLKRNPEWQ